MTKKHFIALADAIKAFNATNAGAELDAITRGILIRHLADFCASQSLRFNRERWLGYIAGSNGKNGGVRKAKREYQPKTGQACGCRPGMQRDNCPQCEGTGQRIDFAAIRGAR